MSSLTIEPIPAFNDNYLWLLKNLDKGLAIIIDPGDAAPVLQRIKELRLSLAAVLITHRHKDHVGGIANILQHFPTIPVYGPSNEVIAGVTHAVTEGQQISIPGFECLFEVIDLPGHTEGHVAYLTRCQQQPLLFCGDTLFSVGCGRIQGGTAKQLYASLQKLAALPLETQIYCTHEYTLSNIDFAKQLEPDNKALQERALRVQAMRANGQPSLPVSLVTELQTNPFLRVQQPAIIRAAEKHLGRSLATSVEVFTAIRQWKDQF